MNSIAKTMNAIGSKTFHISATEAVSYLEELWYSDPTTPVFGHLLPGLLKDADCSALIIVGNPEQLMPLLAHAAQASGWRNQDNR